MSRPEFAQSSMSALVPARLLEPRDVDGVGLALLTLAHELSVLQARQRILESALAAHGIDLRQEIELGTPDADLEAKLEGDRKRLVERLLAQLVASDP